VFITADNDIIKDNSGLSLSPNGKFLLQSGRVIPLDGSAPFKLEELHGASDVGWSPDSGMIAFRFQGVWVLPVSPETGRAAGPARKLADDNSGWTVEKIAWSVDAGQVCLTYRDSGYEQPQDSCLSVQDGKSLPAVDQTRFGLRSPDARSVAFVRLRDCSGLWIEPATGGPTKIADARFDDRNTPLWWSPDGQWLLCGPGPCSHVRSLGFRFVRIADHYVFNVPSPETVGNNGLGLSPDRKKLWFYRNAYEGATVAKAASLQGGGFNELKLPEGFMPICPASAFDGRRVAFLGVNDLGNADIWLTPLAGGDAVRLQVKAKIDGDFNPLAISPDGKRLFGFVVRDQESGPALADSYVIPISLERAETTGPPVLVFKSSPDAFQLSDTLPTDCWSPDSTRLVVPAKARKGTDLWVVYADGSPAKKITDTPDDFKRSTAWSPDSKRISYSVKSTNSTTLYVVSADGGVSQTVWNQPDSSDITYRWSPDAREIQVVSNAVVIAVSLADATTHEIVRGAEAGFDWLAWLAWSPDGKTLLLAGGRYGEAQVDVALFRPSEKKVEKLPSDPTAKGVFVWTADGQRIVCVGSQPKRIHPAGVVYELDLQEAFQKAVASASRTPTKPSLLAADIKDPQAPPLMNGAYTDHFEGAAAPYWRFLDPDTDGPPHLHEVQHGELVLENSRATIGLPDWTNYVFKVRMCIKSLSPGNPTTGVRFRRQAGGAYFFSAVPNGPDVWNWGWWLGVGYNDPANQFRIATITSAPHGFALNTWYTIEVEVRGSHIKASIDGKLVVETDDESHPQGAIGLGATRARTHFDDFSVRQLP
jgi:Tol biopolymer transport system component